MSILWLLLLFALATNAEEEPVCEDCGCTYARGYWAGPRFINPTEDNLTTADRGYTGNWQNSSQDTCKWPSENGSDTRLYVACFNDTENITWFTLMDTSNYDDAFFARSYFQAAKQFISAYLNVLTGACSQPCGGDSSCDQILEIIEHFEQDFRDDNTTCVGDSYDVACTISVCTEFCTQHNVSSDDCTTTNILDLFNQGSVGPGHCLSCRTDNTSGCCVGQNESETCEFDSARFEPAESLNPIVIGILVFVGAIVFFLLVFLIVWAVSKKGDDNGKPSSSKFPVYQNLGDTLHTN